MQWMVQIKRTDTMKEWDIWRKIDKRDWGGVGMQNKRMKIQNNNNKKSPLAYVKKPLMGHGQVWEIQTHNVVMTSLFHKAPPHATYLYNYLPQVLVHRATPRARCHRGHCARKSRRQPFRGQWGEKRWRIDDVCWCVVVCGWWGR